MVLEGTNPLIGTSTDENGNYQVTAPVGSYTVVASFVGYRQAKKFNIVLTSGNNAILNFELEEESTALDEVVIKANASVSPTSVETPLSVQRLTTEEIKSNPGGNFDISRVVQTLPGVSTSVGGVRNDVIIRGGAPNENVYYLDGIEIPVINHFTTQGSAGGPQGILNVSFIEDVTLSTSAFPARYDNALSGVFEFKQRDGNKDRLQTNIRLSGTELATTFDGPITPKTTFLASARRSYLQLFFELIDLPIRPNYWDFQYKITHELNKKTTLTSIGVGAIDEFTFAIPKETSIEKEYVIRSNPIINQNSYTVGLSLRRLLNGGYMNVALSRNFFDNQLDKFEDGKTESLRTLDASSTEAENKIRLDINKTSGNFKLAYGMNGQYVQFSNKLFSVLRREIRDENENVVQPGVTLNYATSLNFFRYGGYVQTTQNLFRDRVSLSAGLRTDMNTFTTTGNNGLKTLSPRVSLSYTFAPKWNFNASVGRYYKLPIYTVLGYQDQTDNFVNKDNLYIRSDHYVGGVEFLPTDALRLTLEGFYKRYNNYPVSATRGISLANDGSEFGAIGNERVESTGEGTTYGFEFFVQKKLTKKIFYVLAYTWYKSQFSGIDDRLISSSWDNRNLISALLGQKLNKGWEIGVKYRYAGGSPYTPFDEEASRLNYLSLGTGVPDVDRLNSERLGSFSQVDLRIDKKWNYRQFTFDLYFDVQNLLMSPSPSPADYTFDRNDDGSFKTTNGEPIAADGSNAIPILLEDDDPFFVPTIGFIIEF